MFCLRVCVSVCECLHACLVCVCVCVCVCHGFRPISWKSVLMLNRGCNQPVISHVHRKVCLADWGVVYLSIQLITAPGRLLKIFWLIGTDNKSTALLFNNEDSFVKRWKFQQHTFMRDLPFCPPWRKNITCNDASAVSFAQNHVIFCVWFVSFWLRHLNTLFHTFPLVNGAGDLEVVSLHYNLR